MIIRDLDDTAEKPQRMRSENLNHSLQIQNGGRQIVFCHVIRDQFATFYMSWGLFLRTEFQVQFFDIWKFVSYGKSDLVSKRFGLCFTYCNDSSTSCQDPQSTVDFSIC